MDPEVLRSHATIQEWEFHSALPIVGRIVSAVRRGLYALSGKWALRVAMQQQSTFNNQILDLIEDQRGARHVFERVANLERQMIESDRAMLQTQRDLATLRIVTSREITALNAQVAALGSGAPEQLSAAVTTVRVELNARLAALDERCAHLEDSHDRVAQTQREMATLQQQNDEILGLLASLRRERRAELMTPSNTPNGSVKDANGKHVSPDDVVDYFLFELRYRGSTKAIARRHERYLPYFQTDGDVLDLGCGRGEFLTLLLQQKVRARGVDLDPDMVDYCRQNGLPVELADLTQYLEKAEDNSLGGIFLGQVVEHLTPSALVRLINLAYRKLKPNACIVAETINPMCLLALTTHYLMDMSHVQPVHPEVLRFLLQSAGFADVTVSFSEPVPDEARLKRLPATDGLSPTEQQWLPILNENTDRLNDFVYGYQDYSIVGRKFAWPDRLASPSARRDLLAAP